MLDQELNATTRQAQANRLGFPNDDAVDGKEIAELEVMAGMVTTRVHGNIIVHQRASTGRPPAGAIFPPEA